MTQRTTPPYRADHVGSFLRPKTLLDAREQAQSGAISRAELRKVEDAAIRDIVKFQEDLGLQGITDGEFRRTYFHIDFLEQLDGVETRGGITASFHGKAGDVSFAPPVMHVTGKVRHARPIQLADFEFLKAATKRVPKVTIPSPTMLHFRGGRAAISREAYPDLEAFYDDVAAAYRDELKQLADAGCRYVQLDDTNLAYLCDPKLREGAKSRGDDPDELPRRYAKLINAAIAGRPKDMAVCVHLCRGNFKSAWVAEGGYEPVAEALFRDLAVDGYFLEYDDARSATSRRSASCRRARSSSSASSPRRWASSRRRTTSSAASTKPRAMCRSSSSRCRRNAASRARCTATRSCASRRRRSSV